MNNRIIVVCGFSGAGKDKITKYLSDHYNYNFIISHSSRPMRLNESEGNPYYFVSRKHFEYMIDNNEFIEYRTYNTLVNNTPDTWYYGVHEDSIDLSKHSYVVVLDIHGLREFKKHYGDKIVSFFINVNEAERKIRAYKNRPDFDLTEWNRRYADDLNQFPIEAVEREVDYIVDNYDFDECIKEIIEKIGEYNEEI